MPDVKRKIVARCSGCGFLTPNPMAIKGCYGRCQDPSGKTCDAVPCPQCKRLHYWSGHSGRSQKGTEQTARRPQ